MKSELMMHKLNSLPERALELVGQVSDGLRHVPGKAGKWLDTGAKLGALKAGTRVAGGFVRKHPAAAVATVAGAGLLWYLARRKAKQAENGAIEGSATRVEAKRGNGTQRRTSGTRRARATTAD